MAPDAARPHKRNPRGRRGNRASQNKQPPLMLHRAPLGVTKVELLDVSPHKGYVRWNKTLLEINNDLISEHICPADLHGVPCEHDELEFGCPLLRICPNLVKYRRYKCPNLVEGDHDIRPCPHIHKEILQTCRFVAREHRPPHTRCEGIRDEDRSCRFGHDYPEARQGAYDHYHMHVLEARREGSKGVVKFKKMW